MIPEARYEDVASSIRSLLGIDSATAELDPAGLGLALGRLALPGQLGVFTDEAAIQRLDRIMKRKGYLPADSLATTFTLL